ncbi:MAG TPA: hypothetical protein PLN38_08260 [Chitinophagales bacterium]|nr:hypothetical protein [Chitinophagales bacterium]
MEDTNQEISVVEMKNADVYYSQDKASLDNQVTTAKAFPRNVTRAVSNSIALVTMDIETASTCTYSVPRGGKTITGVSVHLAKILAQNWGNMRIEAKVVAIDAKHVTSQAIAFDLENNIAIKVEVKRSIVGNYGRYSDDMITVTGNAGNSIAMRNAILSVIPRAVVDKVYREAMKTITGDISDATKLMAKRKKVMDGFKDSYGVSEAEVLKAIGKASVDHIDAENLVVLIGIAQAIKDGDTTVEESFRAKSKETKTTATVEAEMPKIEVKVSESKSKNKAKESNNKLELE